MEFLSEENELEWANDNNTLNNDILSEIKTSNLIKNKEEIPISEAIPHDEKEEILLFNYNEWIGGPDCFEKSLNIISFKLFERRKNPEKKEEIKIELQKHFENALKRFEVEQEHDRKLKMILDSCDNDLKMENWDNFLKGIKVIIKKSFPLKILYLKWLMAKISITAKAICGKDVILLLGQTGAGRSTITHYLAGSQMRLVKVQGIPHIEPYFNDKIPNIITDIKCSPYIYSETSYLTAVPINVKSGVNNNVEVVICETPGFKHSMGAEVEIAKGHGMIDALKNTKSVRPSLVINNYCVNKYGTWLNYLVEMVSEMMPDWKACLENFNYIITRCSEKEFDYLKLLFHGQLEYRRGEENNDVLDMIEDIFYKTCDLTDYNLVNPLDDFRATALLKKLMKATPIKRPKDNFKNNLTEESKLAISEQMKKDEESIFKALERREFEFVLFKLNLMKYLKDILSETQAHLIVQYKSIITEIINKMDSLVAVPLQQIERSFSPGNELRSSDLDWILNSRVFHEARNLYGFLKEEFPQEKTIPELDALKIELNFIVQSYYEAAEKLDPIEEAESFKEFLQKFSVIQSGDNQLQTYYIKLLDKLGERVSAIIYENPGTNMFTKHGETLEQSLNFMEHKLKENISKIVKPLRNLNFSYENEEISFAIMTAENIFDKLTDLRVLDVWFEGIAKLRKVEIDLIIKKIADKVKKIENTFAIENLKTGAFITQIKKLMIRKDQALNYLDLLARSKFAEGMERTAKGLVGKFFLYLGNELMAQLNENMKNITGFLEEESSKPLTKNIEQFIKNYQSALLIRNTLETLDGGLNIENPQALLSGFKEFALSLETEMNLSVSLNRVANLNTKLVLCKSLIALDYLLDQKSAFQNLYRKFSNNQMTLCYLVDDMNFNALQEEIDELKTANDQISQTKLKNLKAYLDNFINQFKEDLSQKIRTMRMKTPEGETYSEVVRQVKKMEKIAILNDSNFIDLKEIIAFLHETKTKSLKNVLLAYTDVICDLIDNLEYESAEKEQAKLILLIETYNSTDGESFAGPDLITETFVKIENKIKGLGETFKAKYKKMGDIKLYPPKDAYQNLEKSIKFKTFSQELVKTVEEIVQNKLDKIISSNEYSLMIKSKKLKKLSNNLKYIPETSAVLYAYKINEKLDIIDRDLGGEVIHE